MVLFSDYKMTEEKGLKIFGVTIVVVGLITGIYFYRQGKKQTTIAPLPFDNNGTNIPSDIPKITTIAEQMYNDMKGINWKHDASIYGNALSLSNTDFVELYNIYNTKYQADMGTLTESIAGEWSDITLLGADAWNTVKKSMLDRLASLNLK